MSEWYARKVGPLPLGAWAAIGGLGIGAVLLLTKRNSGDSGSSGGETSDDVQPNTPSGYIPTPVPVYTPSGPDTTNTPKTPPITTTPTTKNVPGNTGSGTSPTPAPKKDRTPEEPKSAVKYPGIPDGFVLSSSNTYTGLLFSSYEQLWANQKQKGQNDTFTWRNVATIAIHGNPTPWGTAPDINAVNRVLINQRRVRYGLWPLTDAEFDEMQADINSHGGHKKESERNFKNDDYSRYMWGKWNRPYQLGVSQIRKTR